MHDLRRKILCALTLSIFLVGATPVVSQAAEADLVAIIYNGQVIEVGPIAAAFHLLFHDGDTLDDADDPCVPPCDDGGL